MSASEDEQSALTIAPPFHPTHARERLSQTAGPFSVPKPGTDVGHPARPASWKSAAAGITVGRWGCRYRQRAEDRGTWPRA